MSSKLSNRARNLRKNQTAAEIRLWFLLKNRHLNRYKFRRQYVIAPYIVDFICLKQKLIIELDGGQHILAETYDKKRTEFLEAKGYRVLRFWNTAVFSEWQNVLETILYALYSRPHPFPLPQPPFSP